MHALSLATAPAIVDAAAAEARRRELAPLGIAVLDAGGHLIVFKREDGATFLRFDIAFGKAGLAGMGFGTAELAHRAERHPSFVGALTAASGGRIVPSPGGVLIADDSGHVIGAVGISGDAGPLDEACALARVAAAGLTAIPGAPSEG